MHKIITNRYRFYKGHNELTSRITRGDYLSELAWSEEPHWVVCDIKAQAWGWEGVNHGVDGREWAWFFLLDPWKMPCSKDLLKLWISGNRKRCLLCPELPVYYLEGHFLILVDAYTQVHHFLLPSSFPCPGDPLSHFSQILPLILPSEDLFSHISLAMGCSIFTFGHIFFYSQSRSQ